MKRINLILFSFIGCFLVLNGSMVAQENQNKEKQVIIKKSKKSDNEKNVWVNVSVNNGVKHTQVTVEDHDGGKKVYEWDGDEMPEDIHQELGDLDIEIIELDPDKDEMIHHDHMDIHVDTEDEGGHKRIRIEIKDSDGEDKVIEWEGDGDIPIDILKDLENHGEHIFIFDSDDIDENQNIIKKSGKDGETIKIKIKKKDGEVFEWIGDDNIPEDVFEKIGENKMIDHIDVQKVKTDNKAFLGVYAGYKVETIHENNQEDTKTEVEIMDVVEGSGAEKAGLKKGDVILSIAGQEIKSAKDLSDAIAPFEPGDIVEVSFVRDGEKRTVKATLGAPQEVDLDNHKEVIIIKEIEKTGEGHENSEIHLKHGDIELKKTLLLDGVQIFPNPSNGMIRLKFNGDAGSTTLRLTTIRGKKLYEEKIDDFGGTFDKELSIKRYPKGAILLSIEQNGGVYQEQIIHQ